MTPVPGEEPPGLDLDRLGHWIAAAGRERQN
jgi:hypothetical protein